MTSRSFLCQNCTAEVIVRIECAIQRLPCVTVAFSAMLDDEVTEKEAALVAQLKAAVAPLVQVNPLPLSLCKACTRTEAIPSTVATRT